MLIFNILRYIRMFISAILMDDFISFCIYFKRINQEEF